MNAHQYSEACRRLNLTNIAAADFLGVNESTSRRWIKDDRVPKAVAMLLTVMLTDNLWPKDVERMKPQLPRK